MIVLKVLSCILFNTTDAVSAAGTILFIAGLCRIFVKFGEKGWKALIPCYRLYVLGECVGRVMEGRVMFILEILSTIAGIVTIFTPDNGSFELQILIVLIMLSIAHLIYQIRLYIGLTEAFGRRKRWAFLWFFLRQICALLWGFSGKFQPLWQVKDIRRRVENFFSTEDVDILGEGLTVNLKERTKIASFQKFRLLRDIHLVIHPGRMVLLLGGSGAGKTTFVNAINGYEKANAKVMLNGSDVYKDYNKMKYEVGFVPQQDLMRGNDTVLRTLMDTASLRLPVEFTVSERRKRVDEVMNTFGLLPVQNSFVRELSGGQRKRLSIAMEFISNPSLFILDEPDSGLDGVMATEVMHQLRKIADQGKIVIVITHTPDRVIEVFDDVIVLAKDENLSGRLAFYGTISEAREFFGKEDMEQIVKSVNRPEEGGEGRADEFIRKYAEAHHD